MCLLVLQETLLYNRKEDWLKPESVSEDGNSRLDMDLQASVDEPYSNTEIQSLDPLRRQCFSHLSFYVRHHWVFHARKSAETYSKYSISSLLEGFLGMPTESSAAYQCWLGMTLNYVDRPDTSIFARVSLASLRPTSIASFAICYLGFAFLLPNWHNYNWVKEDPRTEGGESLLELASISGQIELCRGLFKSGAEVDAQIKSNCGSALASASAYKKPAIVKFLVNEARAEVNM